MDLAKAALSELQTLIQQSVDDSKLLAAYVKVEKKLKSEIRALQKQPTARTNRSSSNLPYLYGVIDVLKQSNGVQQVITDWKKYNLRIDVVCDGGRTWKKVIARDPQSLHLIWAGNGHYGHKDAVSTLAKYVEAAKRESEYSPPAIACVFTKGVTADMAEHLESTGVKVEGARVPVSEDVLRRLQGTETTDDECSDYSGSEEAYSSDDSTTTETFPTTSSESDDVASIVALPTEQKIFLDVTTMVIYVSDVCNGGENFQFKDAMMAEQAEQERVTPVKPFIDKYFKNRRLITCQAAMENYTSFMSLLGGAEEQERAAELVKRITVVPDDVSGRFQSLKEHGKVCTLSSNRFYRRLIKVIIE